MQEKPPDVEMWTYFFCLSESGNQPVARELGILPVSKGMHVVVHGKTGEYVVRALTLHLGQPDERRGLWVWLEVTSA